MNNQEKRFFQALSADRADSANTLEKPSMRGVKKSVVDKYSDQAHFIYELLQNADDALATSVRFILEPSRLIFAHNGKRLFSVSDPATEDEDAENGCLGDINAITSIANSNKTEASIGKFGVGFKAVFQYTSTPHIYDPNFRFKIERFIVPVELDADFPGRKDDETLFVFPFDHNEKTENEAFSEISDKLINLSYPLLFLSQLKEIEFEFSDTIGLYSKSVEKIVNFSSTKAEYISLVQNSGNDIYEENLWLFSRIDENKRRYSVGFFTDENGHLRPVSEPAFCFFPTKEVTGLNFIIHAAFLLTDSREGIRAGVGYNDKLINALSNLAADSIKYLKEISLAEPVRLIDDSIVYIIPYDPELFSNPSDKRKVSFKPFYNAIKHCLSNGELLPSLTGYTDSKNAYWASVPQLPQLFSNEQLAEIVDNSSAKWVFASLSRDEVQRNNKALFSFIDNLTRTNINEDVIISGRSRDSYYDRYLDTFVQTERVKGIDRLFIEHQSIEWLHTFYKWISESKHRTEIIQNKEVFLDQNGHACAAYDDDDQHILFLPVKDIDGYTVVHPELLENPDTKKFMIDIGIKQPSLKDQIYNIILPMYEDGADIDTDPHFMMFFNYYCKCSNDEVDDFIELIKEYEFVTYYDDGVAYRGKASDLYIPSPEMIMFFSSKPSTRFVALDEYRTLVGKDKEKQLISFLSELGAKDSPSIIESPDNYSAYYDAKTEYLIDGLKELITAIADNKDKSFSVFLWKQLCFLASNRVLYRIRNTELLSRPDGRYNFRRTYVRSSTFQLLRSSAWLMNSEGQFVTSQEVDTTTLSDLYDTELDGADSLISDYLDIREPIVIEPKECGEEDVDDNLTDEQREKIALANGILAMGLSLEEIEELRELKRQKEAELKAKEQINRLPQQPQQSNDESYSNICEDNYETSEKRHLSTTTSNVIKDITKRTKDKPSSPVESIKELDEDYDFDADDFTPVPVDYSKRIEKAKEKSAA
ncbi:MAG: DNA helicase, partial [Oscillospiraceae bacterium]|nr:DNA helicase [Oscillospiraceae bacterium]